MTATLERLPAPPSGPSHSFVGTWQLARLALRRDRIVLPLWIVILSVIPSSNAGAYDTLYPTVAERAALTASIGANPSVAVLYGPAFDLSTAGGYAAWRLGGFMALFIGLMAVFTVTRHTRAEEDTGRAELLASTVLGRYAALTSAVLVSGAASLLIGLISAAALAGAGLPAAGAFAFGLSTAFAGLVFTAIAAVAVQLAEYSRTANGIGAAAVGVAFLCRAVGDSTVDTKWISWLSPIGWAQQSRPFAGERWWVLFLPLVATVLIGAVAYTLLPRRDFGVGILPPRPGPAVAAPGLRTPLALAWRLHRGPLIGWTIGLAVCGAVFGSIASGIGDIVGDSDQTRQMLERMGGSSVMTDTFLAAMVGVFSMTVSLYGVQAALRMRSEETSNRVEPLLSTSVGRLRWAASHLVFAFLGSAVVVLVTGITMGLANGMRTHDVSGSVGDMVLASLVQLPAVWVIVGVTVTLFGVLPKAAPAAWGVAGAALLISMFGPVVNAPQAILDVSPFSHVPKLPGQEVTATPLAWLCGIALAALGAGLVAFRRRDIG
ncbi:MAG: polyether ionophore transport system permease protein [Actinomycetota bacterium]|jgi:ABC-2 type transport system permease protein|nr:polyether ionophore transport system permease protein [Actinomycetota bacterium]